MATIDISTIDRPYDNHLNRSSSSDVSTPAVDSGSDTGSSGSTDSSSTSPATGSSNSEGNGNVQEQNVKNAGAIGDVWVNTFIRSTNWKPRTQGFTIEGQNGYAEFCNVFVSGNIQALTGLIGGFTIGATDISATSGGNTTIISSGPTAFSSGPTGFPTVTITQAGVLTASGAIISGTLTATLGFIGGWTISANAISDTSGFTGMSSAITLGDDIRFWAGDATPANAPFKVTEAGVITASSGTIGGCTLSTTSIGSTTFVSGPLGSGWNISNTGVAEFQNVTVRGSIRTSVFEKDTISAINGLVMITKSDILSTNMTAVDTSTLTIKGDTSFVVNEVIRIKDGVDDEYLLVTGVASAPTYNVTRDLASTYPVDTNPTWKAGTAVVSLGVGTGTKTGYISLDSSSSNSPFVDIYGRNSNTYSDVTLHARLGWLKGITDADVGLATTDVWGLYTDNAYIKGSIVANTGYIGGNTGWVITSNYIKDVAGVTGMSSLVTAGDDVRFWAGHVTPTSAPFYVTEAGVLVASSATITGAINATSGKIGTSTNYWSIGATGITATSTSTDVVINYGKTDFGQDSTAGFILGYDFSVTKPKFEIGSSSTKLFKYDGTNLSITGGTITGGTIQTATGTGQRVVIDSVDNKITFYNASNAEVVQMGGGANISSAIRIVMDADTSNGINVSSAVAGYGYFYSNASDVINRGIFIQQTSNGSNNQQPCVELHHGGHYYSQLIDATHSAGGIYIGNAGALSSLYLNHSANVDCVQLFQSGDGNSIEISHSHTGTNSAILMSYAGTGSSIEINDNNSTSNSTAGIKLNYARQGPGMEINVTHNGGNPTGIKMAINNSGGNEYAFEFAGAEVVSSAVVGTQNKKVRILIGGAVYYLAAYDG